MPQPAADAWSVAMALLPLVEVVAKSLCRRRACDFDDLVQEGLIAVWQAWSRFDPARGSPERFASAIAGNRMRDWLRRSHVREILPGGDLGTAIARPDRIDESEYRDVIGAMDRLPAGCRFVARRRLAAGRESLSPDAIGAALGCCRRTVYRVETRAIARLRVALDVDPR